MVGRRAGIWNRHIETALKVIPVQGLYLDVAAPCRVAASPADSVRADASIRGERVVDEKLVQRLVDEDVGRILPATRKRQEFLDPKELRRRVGQVDLLKPPEPAALKGARSELTARANPFVHASATSVTQVGIESQTLDRHPIRSASQSPASRGTSTRRHTQNAAADRRRRSTGSSPSIPRQALARGPRRCLEHQTSCPTRTFHSTTPQAPKCPPSAPKPLTAALLGTPSGSPHASPNAAKPEYHFVFLHSSFHCHGRDISQLSGPIALLPMRLKFLITIKYVVY